MDYLPLCNGRRARGCQLGRLLDLDQAHPTNTGDGQARMIAVVWDQNSHCLGGLENHSPFSDADRPAFDREVHHLLLGHYATAAVTGWKRRPWIRASNSLRNFLIPDTTGTAHESLSTQMVLPVICSAMSSSVSRSSMVPSPSLMRSRILVVQAVPSRHWVHCAQLSWAKKRAMRAITVTIGCASSMTITPPEPSIEPCATKPS